MSLINDVLRDLDRRNISPPTQPVASVTPARRRANHWPWLLLAAIVCGALIHLALTSEMIKPTENQQWAKLSRPNPVVNADLAVPLHASSDKPATGSENNLAAPEAEPEPAMKAPSLPAVDDQSEAQATPVIDMTAQLRSADAADKAERIAPTTSSASRPAERTEPPRQAVAEQDQPLIRIERAAPEADQADQASLAARRALARGQTDLARQLLGQRLSTAPQDNEARLLLARLLINSGQRSAAQRLLEQGLEGSPESSLAAELGRLLLTRGEAAAAMTTLSEHAPDSFSDPDYHLLLAAAQRQSGEHLQALESYRALGRLLPDNATVWVGLGSTLESLSRPDEAMQAYRQALSGEDRRAVAFARDRLDALNVNGGRP